MEEITLAPFDPAHPERLVPLFEAQFREHAIPSAAERIVANLRTLARHPEQGFVLTATSAGAPMGVAYAARILSLEHGGWSGWLEEFYFLPEWRGRGVGTRLLTAVIAEAKARGWAALDLEVDASHERVIGLYAGNGFEPVARNRFGRRLARESGK